MSNPVIKSSRPYAQRSPVARFFKVGNVKVNGIQRTLWGFMSFYNGIGKLPTFGAYAGLAPVDEHGYLRIEQLAEGDIVVEPGLVYKPVPPMDVTGKMMAEHERAMKTWRPKVQYSYEKEAGPAIDLGPINLSKEKLH